MDERELLYFIVKSLVKNPYLGVFYRKDRLDNKLAECPEPPLTDNPL